jgi:hypothetical protein
MAKVPARRCAESVWQGKRPRLCKRMVRGDARCWQHRKRPPVQERQQEMALCSTTKTI